MIFIKHKSLILLAFLLVSCAEQSEVKPLFQPKSFYEATGGQPIKLIIPITDKSMDKLDPAAITMIKSAKTNAERAEYIKTPWHKKLWEGIKGTTYSLAAKMGLGKISISIEHSLADIGIDASIVKDNIRSVKISKAFFSFHRPCELNPDDQACRDYVGIFKKKTPSFKILNKAIINMSLVPENSVISDEVEYEMLANEALKKQNELLLKPQIPFESAKFQVSSFLPQNFNLAYFNKENYNLESYYILKSTRDHRRNILVIKTSQGRDFINNWFLYLANELDLNKEDIESLFKFEYQVDDYGLKVDFNEFKEFKNKYKEFAEKQGLLVEQCSMYLCIKPKKLGRGEYYFKGIKGSINNIFFIKESHKDVSLNEIFNRLADRTQIPSDLLEKALKKEIIRTKDYTLIDLNRFPSLVKEFKDLYSLKYQVSPCGLNQCQSLGQNLKSRDNIVHLRTQRNSLDKVSMIDVEESEKVIIKNEILALAAVDLNKDINQLKREMLTNIVPLHNQIYFNFNEYPESYQIAFENAFDRLSLKQRTCSEDQCLFLPTNKLNLKPILSKSTAGKIDIYLDVNKVPKVALFLKGYLELEIVLDI